MLLEANTTARDVTDWEKAKAVEEYGKILDEMKAQGEELEGRRRDHIAAALGMSKTNVGRFENINKNLSGEYQEELKAGTIGVSVADKIASLPEEQQKELHEEKGADVKLADVEAIKDVPDSGTQIENEEPSDEETEYRRIRLEGLCRALMYLRKSKNRFGQHADVEQEDGNEEETKILRMAGSIFAEMETGFFFGAIEETGTDWSVFLKRVAEEEEMRRN